MEGSAGEFLRRIAMAVVLGLLLARAGFAWGGWMRKVRR
jgi:hypothetical protein